MLVLSAVITAPYTPLLLSFQTDENNGDIFWWGCERLLPLFWRRGRGCRGKRTRRFFFLQVSLWDSVTRFFASGFFHDSSSPKPLKITLGVMWNYFENSWRYSQVKVHQLYQRHRWQICHQRIIYILRRPPSSTSWGGIHKEKKSIG